MPAGMVAMPCKLGQPKKAEPSTLVTLSGEVRVFQIFTLGEGQFLDGRHALTVYDLAYLEVMVANLVALPLIFLLIQRLMLRRIRKEAGDEE